MKRKILTPAIWCFVVPAMALISFAETIRVESVMKATPDPYAICFSVSSNGTGTSTARISTNEREPDAVGDFQPPHISSDGKDDDQSSQKRMKSSWEEKRDKEYEDHIAAAKSAMKSGDLVEALKRIALAEALKPGQVETEELKKTLKIEEALNSNPPDWCWIKSQAENLLRGQPRSFDECSRWLITKKNLDSTVQRAYIWRGTMVGMQCYDDAIKAIRPLGRREIEVKDLQIEFANRNPLIRYVKKQFNPYAPERIVFTVGGVAASVLLGGTPVALAALSTVSFGTAREAVGVLEQDGYLNREQAAEARLLLSVANALSSIESIDVSRPWADAELTAHLAKFGIEVNSINRSVHGYQLKIREDWHAMDIEINISIKRETSGVVSATGYVTYSSSNTSFKTAALDDFHVDNVFGLTNSPYSAWCIDRQLSVPRSRNRAAVFNPCDGKWVSKLQDGYPSRWARIPWNKLTHIINMRRRYSMGDIQNAIWHFTNNWSVSGGALALVNDANLNARKCDSYKIRLLVIYISNNVQPLVIEYVR